MLQNRDVASFLVFICLNLALPSSTGFNIGQKSIFKNSGLYVRILI